MLTALVALVGLAVGAPQDSAHLVIVATADVRGRVLDWDYLADAPAAGGVARVATIVDSLRARYPGQVVVVDAGNVLSGDAFATYVGRIAPRDPHPVVEALNLAGYDAGTPGGHDFDLGFATMRRAFGGAAFPYVSANLLAADGDTLLYPSQALLRRGGVRIAVTGFTSPSALARQDAELRTHLRATPIGAVAPAALARARAQADVVVALVQAEEAGEIAAVTAAPSRPDLVVTGALPEGLADSAARGVPVVQPGETASMVAVVHLSLARMGSGWRVRAARVDRVATSGTAPAARVSGRLAAEHAAARTWAQARISWTDPPWFATGGRAGPSALVDLVNWVQRRRAGADLAATPLYSLTAGFTGSWIRRADVLALYPFDYRLVAVRITGAQLKRYLEHAARYFAVDAVGRVRLNDSVPGDAFDIVGGATYEIDLHAPAGDRIRQLAVRGRPVQPADSFTMALSNHRRNGAGGYDLAGAPVVYDRGEYIRDLLMEEIGRHESLNTSTYLENGWRIVPVAAAESVRGLFGLPGAPPPPAAPRDSTVLRVLALGGFRGRLEVAPVLATIMDRATRACSCPTLRLTTGDGVPAGEVAGAAATRASLDLLGRLGFAAAVPGERELDWPRDTLRQYVAASSYPWLAANVFDTTSRAAGQAAYWSEPYRIVGAGGMRVAVVGYVAPEVSGLVSAERAAGVRLVDGMLGLRAALDEVRAAHPDVTVLLAHGSATALAYLAGTLPRGSVDVILTAQEADTVGVPPLVSSTSGGIPVVRLGGGRPALVAIDVIRTVPGGREIRARTVPIVYDIRPDQTLAPLAERWQRQVDSVLAAPVATVKLPLQRDDPRLGQLVAAARRNALRADVGLALAAGVRSGLPAGSVAYRDLLRVQPFNRALVTVTLNGKQLRRLLEQVVSAGEPAAFAAGLQVRYDPKRSAGHRVRQVTLDDGRELRDDGIYRVVVDEAMLAPAAELSVLREGPAARSALLDADALVRYLRRLPQPVEPSDHPGFRSTAP